MYKMGYCYLCEKEWTGYWGQYFCADCENLKKVVMVIGSKRITDNIKWNTSKIIELEPISKRTRSNDSNNIRV